jgi:hypothetical protein
MAAIYRIGKQQPGGKQFKALSGWTQFSVGQQGSNTVDPACDAYEQFIKADIEMYGIGLPNNLSTPTSALNNLGPTHKRFTVMALPMVPYNTGSVDLLVNSTTYDAQHRAIAKAVVDAGFDEDSGIRCGHEYNSGSGNSGGQGFMWATRHTDPNTGLPVGIGPYKAAAAKVEGFWRDAGYKGYFIWSGGTSDTSALKIDDAIPTHGDPDTTAWDFDIYPGPKYGTTKNDEANAWALIKNSLDKYVAYCRANGIVMGTSEYGHTYKISSPFVLNDEPAFYHHLYNYAAANADVYAWLGHYQQNQFNSNGNGIVDESHLIALSIGSSTGSPAGVPSTAKYVGDVPPGYTTATTTTQSGTTPTLAQMGSLQHSSSNGLYWQWTTDPNKQDAMTSWRETFGGFGTTGGAAGLQIPIVAPVIPDTVRSSGVGRKVRRSMAVYG